MNRFVLEPIAGIPFLRSTQQKHQIWSFPRDRHVRRTGILVNLHLPTSWGVLKR